MNDIFVNQEFLVQKFANGVVNYKLISGIVFQLSVFREAWIKWDDAEYPDVKYTYDAAVGQRVVLLEIEFKSNDKEEVVRERLCIFNKNTRQLFFFYVPKRSIPRELWEYELRSKAQSFSDEEYKLSIERISKKAKTQHEVNLLGSTRHKVIKIAWTCFSAYVAYIGYGSAGIFGGIFGYLLGWIVGYPFVFLFYAIYNKITPTSQGGESSARRLIVGRIEEIQKNLLNGS